MPSPEAHVYEESSGDRCRVQGVWRAVTAEGEAFTMAFRSIHESSLLEGAMDSSRLDELWKSGKISGLEYSRRSQALRRRGVEAESRKDHLGEKKAQPGQSKPSLRVDNLGRTTGLGRTLIVFAEPQGYLE
jgi:hypothetical protein